MTQQRFIACAAICAAALLLALSASSYAEQPAPISPGPASPPSAAAPSPATDLDHGYSQMYDLDFSGAHATFHAWQQSHPDDSLGFVSDAAAYLFAEFNRLHILETDLFTDDKEFESRSKPAPDPAAKAAFEADLARATQLEAQTLSRSPGDINARLAQVLENGLRGDYASLIENRNLAGLGYMKSARALAEKLLADEPLCYDAYLAIGVENYLLGLNPAPVRWFLWFTGAETDKQDGIAKLRLTAEKGRYLAPFARLLLAVAALRGKDRATARTLLDGLSQQFPQNPLYARELARITP